MRYEVDESGEPRGVRQYTEQELDRMERAWHAENAAAKVAHPTCLACGQPYTATERVAHFPGIGTSHFARDGWKAQCFRDAVRARLETIPSLKGLLRHEHRSIEQRRVS